MKIPLTATCMFAMETDCIASFATRAGGATPHCTKFQDLEAYLVGQVRPGDITARPPSEKVTAVPARETQLFALSPALEWPSYMGVDIAKVGKEGHKLTNQEFEDQPLYFKLFESGAEGTGLRFVDGDYMYLDVRVCRVDSGVPRSQCVQPGISERAVPT